MAEGGERLAIPIGVKDFKEIRDDGYYFVDKSELISDIIQDKRKVFLFTRPRRFGKSLNLSMLDAFFNLEYKGNNWFDGLKINSHPESDRFRNRYPVISLGMKFPDVEDYDLFLAKVRGVLSRLFANYSYLKDSDKVPENLRELFFGEDPTYFDEQKVRDSILTLCLMLYKHHGVKPIVLIDEYDNAINNAYGKGSYSKVTRFISDFYSTTLKDNDYLTFAVMTGVTQIAKEGIFSGLNNLRVNNIFSVKFDERYGFTESEVKELCTYYGHPENFGEAKEWYDGYRFGNADIYNPWSVLFYVKEDFNPETYWAGTSGNDIIDTLLKNADETVLKDLTHLGNGETITRHLVPSISMSDLETESDAIFSVLAVAGYLNAVPCGDGHLLSIPNREMYSVFYEHIRKFVFRSGVDTYAEFLSALENCDIKTIEDKLYGFLSDEIPFPMLDREMQYQLIIAMMVLGRTGRYKVTVERESGNGRHDILMEHRYSKYPNIVLEVKKTTRDSDAESERLAHEALEQIHRKDYFKKLKGTTYLYGIAFNGKKALVLLEKTVL